MTGDPMAEWTASVDDRFDRLVVVSPHFDDAVLGAGRLLAAHPGATVVTVCGGRPRSYPDPPNDWDAAGGFGAGDDVVALRREEDRRALAELGARSVWLDVPEHAYVPRDARVEPEAVVDALEAALVEAEPAAVAFPFGLGNPDHSLTHDACRLLLEREPERWTWCCYEDAGYKHIPGLLAWRISQLFRAGWWPTPAVVRLDRSDDRVGAALARYASQVAPLEARHGLSARLDAGVPEQVWLLRPPPAGWEGLARS